MLQDFYDSVNLFWAKERISRSGRENGEIPCGPIYMTSCTLCQPKIDHPLEDFEKVILEHQ